MENWLEKDSVWLVSVVVRDGTVHTAYTNESILRHLTSVNFVFDYIFVFVFVSLTELYFRFRFFSVFASIFVSFSFSFLYYRFQNRFRFRFFSHFFGFDSPPL